MTLPFRSETGSAKIIRSLNNPQPLLYGNHLLTPQHDFLGFLSASKVRKTSQKCFILPSIHGDPYGLQNSQHKQIIEVSQIVVDSNVLSLTKYVLL